MIEKEIEIKEEEIEFIELLRKSSDKDKEEAKKYLEENSLEDKWRGKVQSTTPTYG